VRVLTETPIESKRTPHWSSDRSRELTGTVAIGMTTVITMMDDDLFAASVRPNKTLATVDWRLDLNPEIRDCDIPLDCKTDYFE
jgi:hypothetical protein